MMMTSLLKWEVFSSQQMKEATHKVSRLQDFLQLYDFCRGREKKSLTFSTNIIQAC